jgi:hypothetical protein
MRVILVFLILCLCAGRSFAEELIMGRVVSIDTRSGTVALEVLDGPDKLMQEMKKAGSQASRITIDRKALPGPVTENSVVRVWGTFDENSREFHPVRAYAGDNNSSGAGGPQGKTGYGRTNDLTGVRQRIGRGAGGSRGSRGGTQQGSGGGHGGRGGR